MSDISNLEGVQKRLAHLRRVEGRGFLSLKSTAPPVPSLLRNSRADSDTFTFSWLPVRDKRVVGYNVYRADSKWNPAVAERVIYIPQPPGWEFDPITFKDSRIDAQRKYYWVTSVNEAGVESPRVAATLLYDSGPPGQVNNFTVVGFNGYFVITWSRPSTNYRTIDDYVIQSASDASFTTDKVTRAVGSVYRYELSDPNKTLYFRIAVHNRSQDVLTNTDSDLLAIHPDGWGLWKAYGSPTSVGSGDYHGERDLGVPSGASGLTMLQNGDDSEIPEAMIVFQFNRPTSYYKSIWAVEVYLSTSLPAQGPFAAERAAYPSATIETGTCTVTAGKRDITVTRSASSGVLKRPLVIYTTGDENLDGNVIDEEGVDHLRVDRAFDKSGSFNYAVVKRWWDIGGDSANAWEHTFWFPDDFVNQSTEEAVWRTKPVRLGISGDYYATMGCRNYYGGG